MRDHNYRCGVKRPFVVLITTNNGTPTIWLGQNKSFEWNDEQTRCFVFVEICWKHHRLCVLFDSMTFRIDLQGRGWAKIMLRIIVQIKYFIIMSNIKIFKRPSIKEQRRSTCRFLSVYPLLVQSVTFDITPIFVRTCMLRCCISIFKSAKQGTYRTKRKWRMCDEWSCGRLIGESTWW